MRDWWLTFKHLSECWCFAAGLVAMPDLSCGFLRNENKKGWQNKDIQFGVGCLNWYSFCLRPCIPDFVTVILSILYCWNKVDKIRLGPGAIVPNVEVWIMGSHLYVFVKEFLPCLRNRLNKRNVRNMGSQVIESLLYWKH